MTDATLQRDIDLMRRIRQFDQQALAILYHYYGDAVYGLALHILQDSGSAEEVTQDIFLKVWERAIQWDFQKGRLSTWLLAMTRHAAIDRLRQENRRPLVDTSADNVEAMFHPNHDGHDEQELRGLITQLPQEQIQVIQLAFFGGMSQNDIAETLNIPLGTIKTRLRLGLQKLRKLWMDG